jgi:hypothetical protein
MRILPSFVPRAAIVAALLASACGGDETGSGGAAAGGGGGEEPSGLPQIVHLGGPVVAKPKVQPILYASDPHVADIEAFLAELATTPYWSTVTGEYGVGALSVLPAILRPEAPPASTTDTALSSALVANTGAGAAWGPTDPETIYLFVQPEGTIVHADGPCCLDFDGFHDEAKVNGIAVPYAVVCSCPGFDGPDISDVEQITVVMSHELVEAATNPFVWTAPAYAQTDNDNIIWTLTTGGEAADLCTFDPDAFLIPDGSTYMVQRSWSNAAAKAGKDPCLPSVGGAPFFVAEPALVDAVSLKGVPVATRGVKVPIGQTKTIDVLLRSDVASEEPWNVEVFDFTEFFGGAPNLALALDKASGKRGDTLKLSIEALSVNPDLGASAFFLVSRRGTSASLVVAAVGK